MFIKFFKDRSNKKFIERILETRSRNFTNEKIETVGIILNINEFNDFEKIKGISEYLNSRPKLIDIGTWPKVIIDGIEYTSGTNPDYKYL